MSCAVERMYLELGENWTCWQTALWPSARVFMHWPLAVSHIRLWGGLGRTEEVEEGWTAHKTVEGTGYDESRIAVEVDGGDIVEVGV